MAITTLADYKSKVATPRVQLHHEKASLTGAIGRLWSSFTTAPLGGATPTTAVVPTNATVGSLLQPDSTGTQRLLQVALGQSAGGTVFVVDRLSHQGGLSGTDTSAQTTNLPTAALTRYTSGEGVFIGLEIYSALGSTATTVTVTYTNQAGTGGRVTPDTVIGSGSFNNVNRVITLPLQVGDTGVRSVESVTVLATTGTAGNFGVVLYKPLLALPLPYAFEVIHDGLMSMCGNMPAIVNGACLHYMISMGSQSTGVVLTSHKFVED